MCGRIRLLKSLILVLAIVALPTPRHATAENPLFQSAPAGQPTAAMPIDNRVQQATHNESLGHHPPLTTQNASSRKLPPPPSEGGKSASRSGPFSAIITVLGSLAIVLGLFFGIAWLMRRGLPQGAGRLPAGVVEVLGHTSLAARRQMHVLRFGDKLLLVCVSQNGVETLSEIDEPAEVERLTDLCQNSRAKAPIGSFNQVLAKRTRGTAAEQAASSGGLAAMAFQKKSASVGEVST
jgi:flagellar biogenesis protein FliO